MFDTSDVRRLSVDLGKAGVETTRKAGQVIRKSAHDIEARGKSLAPVDTGNLRNSITTTVNGLSAEVGPTAAYAPFLEGGTRKMAARPFMGPAADQVEPAFMSAMEQIGLGGL